MKIDIFINISLRARVAFAILCLENAIDHFDLPKNKWQIVLKKLWELTSMKYVDEWLYSVSKIMYSSILEDNYSEEWKQYLSISEYMQLRELYLTTPNLIFEILDYIFEIGTIDMYGAILDNSKETLKLLKQLIMLISKENIILPNVEPFAKFSIAENDGWGREFTRNEIFV